MHHAILARDYCCAQCGGLLVHRIVTAHEEPRTVCAVDPEHKGFIRKSTALIRRAQAEADAMEVACAYGLFKKTDGSLEDLFG